MRDAYVIGVDYGTDSVRAVILDVADGAEIQIAEPGFPIDARHGSRGFGSMGLGDVGLGLNDWRGSLLRRGTFAARPPER